MTIISRLAPTPSGYLHLGNIANFLLTEKLVREGGGTLALRIDDCDGTRARREFVEHIFETLKWLGFQWQRGPIDAGDFYANFSQVTRKEHYFEKLKLLGGKVFACACSRKEIEEERCRCREAGAVFVRGKHALRLPLEEESLKKEFGDVVLWRKDDGPAYHWASVIDDLEAKVNLIVRGEDLLGSSELQKYIAWIVAPEGFGPVKFLHHPLITDEAGGKLSKSQGSLSLLQLREGGATPESIRERVSSILANWGY